MSRDQLNRILFSLLGGNDLVNLWWKSPIKSFNMNTPDDLWNKDPKQVEEYIMFFAMVK